MFHSRPHNYLIPIILIAFLLFSSIGQIIVLTDDKEEIGLGGKAVDNTDVKSAPRTRSTDFVISDFTPGGDLISSVNLDNESMPGSVKLGRGKELYYFNMTDEGTFIHCTSINGFHPFLYKTPSRFDAPMGAYFSNDNYLYFVDTNYDRMVKTNLFGGNWTTLGSYGSGVGQFDDPRDLAFDENTDFLYVADWGNQRIIKTMMDGTGWQQFPETCRVFDLCFDPVNNWLYSANFGPSCPLRRWSLDGSEYYDYDQKGNASRDWVRIQAVDVNPLTGQICLLLDELTTPRIVLTDWEGNYWKEYKHSLPQYCRDIAVDHDTGYIYLINNVQGLIGRIKIDSPSIEELHRGGYENPNSWSLALSNNKTFSKGYFTSKIIEVPFRKDENGNNIHLQSGLLKWKADIPAGSNLSVRLYYSNSTDDLGNDKLLSQEEINQSTFANSDLELTERQLAHRYFQFNVNFECTIGLETPILDEISLDLDWVPEIRIEELGEELTGPIDLSYILIDGDGDNTNITVQYSTDNLNYLNATPGYGGNASTNLAANPEGMQYTFVWDSETDLPGKDVSEIHIRMRAWNDCTGNWDITGPFHLDNNHLPSAEISNFNTTQADNVTIDFKLMDRESDNLSLLFQYKAQDMVQFKDATQGLDSRNTTSFNSSPEGIEHSFVWNSAKDIGYTPFQNISFMIIPSDNDTGTGATINLYVNNSDLDDDLIPNLKDSDDDNDGYPDLNDTFPLDSAAWRDTDGDGMPDEVRGASLLIEDKDDDDDGYLDEWESYLGSDPKDNTSKPMDTDGDGKPDGDMNNSRDWMDRDDDGDNSTDVLDKFPKNPMEWADLDDDGLGDNSDPDVDGDNVSNDQDKFPLDPTAWLDTDSDGKPGEVHGNSLLTQDEDDDNDGFPDAWEIYLGSNPKDNSSMPLDTDGDGKPNGDINNSEPAWMDLNDDNDNWTDDQDSFPLNALEWADLDGDGVGDNTDPDVDGDNVTNELDPFPLDGLEWADFDGDGIGDNADPDDDNDGIEDYIEIQEGTDPFDQDSKPIASSNDGDLIEVFGIGIGTFDLFGIIVSIISFVVGWFLLTRKKRLYKNLQHELEKMDDLSDLEEFFNMTVKIAIEEEDVTASQGILLKETMDKQRSVLKKPEREKKELEEPEEIEAVSLEEDGGDGKEEEEKPPEQLDSPEEKTSDSDNTMDILQGILSSAETIGKEEQKHEPETSVDVLKSLEMITSISPPLADKNAPGQNADANEILANLLNMDMNE